VHLIYFDENKFSEQTPYFLIGGILIDSNLVSSYEKILSQIQYNYFGTSVLTKETEFHGIDIFQGKGPHKHKKLEDRIQLLRYIADFIIQNKIPIRTVCIDVHQHRAQNRYPQPEYSLGLQLALESFEEFLEEKNTIGLVFGDYEKDEITQSILDFSQFKLDGKTPLLQGRPFGRIMDTIYFTHSHHSRFLQISDVILYLINRFSVETANMQSFTKYHDQEARKIWNSIKEGTDYKNFNWPKK